MWTTETKSPLSPDFLNHHVLLMALSQGKGQAAGCQAQPDFWCTLAMCSSLLFAFTKTGFHCMWDRCSCGLHSAQICPTDTELAGLWGNLLLVANKPLREQHPTGCFAGVHCHAELVRTTNSSRSSEDVSALCREAWQKTQPAEPDQHVNQIPYKWEEVIKPAVKH